MNFFVSLILRLFLLQLSLLKAQMQQTVIILASFVSAISQNSAGMSMFGPIGNPKLAQYTGATI